MVCTTNERYLVMSYRTYFQDTATVLSSTGHGNSGAWDYQLLGSGLTALNYYTKNGRGGPAAGTAPLADEHAAEMITMAAAKSAAIQELRVFMRASVNSRSRNPVRNVAMRTPRGMGLAGYLRIGDCP